MMHGMLDDPHLAHTQLMDVTHRGPIYEHASPSQTSMYDVYNALSSRSVLNSHESKRCFDGCSFDCSIDK
jgi:hypothetical protein